MRYYSDTYLEHHGVKGMRWGVRKDPDRWVANGMNRSYKRARYGLNDKASNAYEARQAGRKKAESSGLNAAANAARTSSSIAKRQMGKSGTTVTRAELDKMSNAELQAAITRANLERQYSSIHSTSTVRDGMSYVLETAGDVLAIAASAATIAVALHQIKQL